MTNKRYSIFYNGLANMLLSFNAPNLFYPNAIDFRKQICREKTYAYCMRGGPPDKSLVLYGLQKVEGHLSLHHYE